MTCGAYYYTKCITIINIPITITTMMDNCMQIRSKKENAEKIWQEIQRRQSQKDNKATKKKKKRSKLTQSTSKKDMTGKQKKRLSALEELMIDDDDVNDDEPAVVESAKQTTEDAAEEESTTNSSNEGGGIFGKIQGFYEKADNMAASQALLLNKELEDRGVIDKITDETGLKVIGKEAASKLDSNKDAEGK